MYPMNIQLAIIAARLEAKSVDNESLFRANTELTVLNSKLQKKIDRLKVYKFQSESNQFITKELNLNFIFQKKFTEILIEEKQTEIILVKINKKKDSKALDIKNNKKKYKNLDSFFNGNNSKRLDEKNEINKINDSDLTHLTNTNFKHLLTNINYKTSKLNSSQNEWNLNVFNNKVKKFYFQ